MKSPENEVDLKPPNLQIWTEGLLGDSLRMHHQKGRGHHSSFVIVTTFAFLVEMLREPVLCDLCEPRENDLDHALLVNPVRMPSLVRTQI